MVNYGGRSKGCLTCRRRRVKCDENRPICNRCARFGVECTGPTAPGVFEFIDQGKSLKEGFQIRVSAKKRPVRRQRTICSETTLMRHWGLSPGAMMRGSQNQAHLNFARQQLFLPGSIVDQSIEGMLLEDIESAAANPQDGHLLLHSIIMMLSKLYFGRCHHEPQTLQRGYAMLGTALQALNTTLRDPKCCHRDDVFVSIIGLFIVDANFLTGPDSKLQHALGMEKLLGLRGPYPLPTPLALQVYAEVRRIILFNCLRTRRETILVGKEWRDIPWINFPIEKTQCECLCDLLAECTSIIAACDNVILTSRRAREKHIQEAQDLLSQLQSWESKWVLEDRNLHVQVSFSCLVPRSAFDAGKYQSLETLFSTIFSFTDTTAAETWMLFNLNLLIVFQCLASLDPLSPSYAAYVAGERSAALEICRCLPYIIFLRSPTSVSTLGVPQCSTKCAWQTLGGGRTTSPESLWIDELLCVTEASSCKMFAAVDV